MKTEEQEIKDYPKEEFSAEKSFVTEKEDHLEIDLKEIFHFVRGNLKKVYLTTAIFFALGVGIALLTPEEYTASTTLLPESGGSGSQTAGNLMRNFGLGNFFPGESQSGSGMGVAMYPQIVQSTPFLINMIDEEIFFAELDSSVTIYSYFRSIKPGFLDKVKGYTLGLPSKVINWVTGPNKYANLPVSISSKKDTVTSQEKQNDPKIKQLTRAQLSVVKKLGENINISVDNTINISSKMPDPMAAAQVTDMTVNYLTDYVKKYKIGKLQEDLEFVEERFAEAEQKFIKAQNALARFRDRNLNITTAGARSEEERLKAEYDLAFGIYRNLGQQLEQSRIKIQEETPVFQVLEPVQVPIEKSAPNEVKIVFLFIFIGVFLGFAWMAGIFVWGWAKKNVF